MGFRFRRPYERVQRFLIWVIRSVNCSFLERAQHLAGVLVTEIIGSSAMNTAVNRKYCGVNSAAYSQ